MILNQKIHLQYVKISGRASRKTQPGTPKKTRQKMQNTQKRKTASSYKISRGLGSLVQKNRKLLKKGIHQFFKMKNFMPIFQNTETSTFLLLWTSTVAAQIYYAGLFFFLSILWKLCNFAKVNHFGDILGSKNNYNLKMICNFL